MDSKAYRLFNKKSLNIEVSIHVTFDEYDIGETRKVASFYEVEEDPAVAEQESPTIKE